MTTPAVSAYSTTPANNVVANTGVTWDEGMAPAAVNNSARQNMADLRSFANDLAWFAYGSGTSPVVVPAYASGTTFTIAGVDVTAVYHVGRRVRAVGSSTGTIYGRISVVAFSTNTTVTVVWDSGSLSNETLAISISQVPLTGLPLPQDTGTWTPIDSSGASLSFSSVTGKYTKVGNVVTVFAVFTFPATADATACNIGGLPFTAANVGDFFPLTAMAAGGGGVAITALVTKNTTTFGLNDSAGTVRTNANNSGRTVRVSGLYFV